MNDNDDDNNNSNNNDSASAVRKMYFKMSSTKCLPFCYGLSVRDYSVPYNVVLLTHLPLDKMGAVLADDNFKFLQWKW